MLPAVVQFKLVTTAMTGFMAASSPAPTPAVTLTAMMDARTVEPIEVPLFDENHVQRETVVIARDGGADAPTLAVVQHLMRCKVTDNEHAISQATLGIIADIADRYHGKEIELVSAYRDKASESKTSPHRAARAVDFRIRNVDIGDLRDYLWRHNTQFAEVGVGWYPESSFLHIDARPGLKSIAWTLVNGANQYHPFWAEAALVPPPARPTRSLGI